MSVDVEVDVPVGQGTDLYVGPPRAKGSLLSALPKRNRATSTLLWLLAGVLLVKAMR